jgi:hypothetical protein
MFCVVVYDSMDLAQIVGNNHREQNEVHLLVVFLHLIPIRELIQLQDSLQFLFTNHYLLLGAIIYYFHGTQVVCQT